MFVDVGARAAFADGVPRVVSVAGLEVGILAWGDELFAVRNVCPHQLGPVCRGHAMALLVDDGPGAIDADAGTPVIVCPWHGWEFDARTGRSIWSRQRYTLRTYPVRLDGGRVLVDVGR